MSRWLTILLPALGGCIVYDHEGKCFGCEDDPVGPIDEGLTGDSGGNEVDDSGGGTVGGYKFVLDPSEAYPGELFRQPGWTWVCRHLRPGGSRVGRTGLVCRVGDRAIEAIRKPLVDGIETANASDAPTY